MTKELESLQRQAIQQANRLPGSSAFATTSQAFSQLGQLGAFAAEKVATTKAQQQGAEAALSGEKRTLAPGYTKATQAFNSAYNNVDASLVTMQVTQDINEDVRRLSSPENLNSNSLAEFKEFADNRVKGALEGVSPEVRATVGLRLVRSYEVAANKMAGAVSQYNQRQAKDSFTTMFASNLDEMNEMRMGGDFEGAKGVLQHTNELIDNYKTLGFMSQAEEFQARKTLNMQMAASDAQASYLEAVASGTEEQFLANLARKKPEGLSNEEWLQAQSEVLKLKGQQDRLTAEQESLSLSQWNQKILTGEVSTLAELEGAANEMSAVNYIGLQNKILQQQMGGVAQAQKMQQFITDNASNPARAARASNEVKNAAYDQVVDAYTEQKREQTGDANATLSLQEKAVAVQNFNVPIQAFNDELAYSLQFGDEVSAMDAALAYQDIAGTPGGPGKSAPVLNLDKSAEQLAVSTLFHMNYATSDPVVAIQNAREGLKPKDDFVREGRLKVYNEKYSGTSGRSKLKTSFKDVFDVNADDNPVLFEAYQRELRENSVAMESVDQAQEMTKRSMSKLWSKSKYNDSNKQVMQYAPEKHVAMIDNGHWFDNQLVMAIDEIAKNNPDITFAGKIPEDLTQEDVIKQRLVSGKPRIVINGKEREVYLQSDPTTASRSSGKLTYGLFYKDDIGFPQPVPNINDPLGVAQFQVMPFEEFLPAANAELSLLTIEQVARKEAAAIFDAENVGRRMQNDIADLSTFGAVNQGVLNAERQQFIEAKSAEIVEKLSGLPVKDIKDRKKLEKQAEKEAEAMFETENAGRISQNMVADLATFGALTDGMIRAEKKKFVREAKRKILKELLNE